MLWDPQPGRSVIITAAHHGIATIRLIDGATLAREPIA